jgi:hypothetical protein
MIEWIIIAGLVGSYLWLSYNYQRYAKRRKDNGPIKPDQ